MLAMEKQHMARKGGRGLSRGIGRNSNSNRTGTPKWVWYALLIAMLAVGVGFGIAFLQVRKATAIDEATLCPESGPNGVLIALLDLSDPLTPLQANRLKNELGRRFNAAPEGTMMSVGIVESDLSRSGIRFGPICRPRSGDEASPFYQNRQLIEQRYETGFEQPFGDAISDMLEGEEQNSSPLMETIHQVVVDTDGFRNREIGKELILVSDLFQNSETFSFYRGETWDDFRNSKHFARKSRFLEGFDVTVIRVPRDVPRGSSNSEIEEFWVNYLGQSGIDRLEVDRITLGGI